MGQQLNGPVRPGQLHRAHHQTQEGRRLGWSRHPADLCRHVPQPGMDGPATGQVSKPSDTSLCLSLYSPSPTHTHTLMHCYLNIAKYKVGELLVRCCKYRHQNTGGFCSSLPVTHAGASSLLTAVLVALSPAGNVPTVPSIGRWWHGTDPTASTLRKAPSRTCALSSSATAMGLTVKSHHCLSPRPGIRSYNNLYQGLFRKMNDFDFDILCMRLQGTSQLSQTLPSASVQSLGSCVGRGCGYQYIGSAGWTSEKPAV